MALAGRGGGRGEEGSEGRGGEGVGERKGVKGEDSANSNTGAQGHTHWHTCRVSPPPPLAGVCEKSTTVLLLRRERSFFLREECNTKGCWLGAPSLPSALPSGSRTREKS